MSKIAETFKSKGNNGITQYLMKLKTVRSFTSLKTNVSIIMKAPKNPALFWVGQKS